MTASNCRRTTQARQHPKEHQEKSAGLHAMEKWWRIWPPILMINWDGYHFSLLNCCGWAKSSELVSGHESTLFPDCWIFWINYLSSLPTFALWLLAFQQGASEPEFGNTETALAGSPSSSIIQSGHLIKSIHTRKMGCHVWAGEDVGPNACVFRSTENIPQNHFQDESKDLVLYSNIKCKKLFPLRE